MAFLITLGLTLSIARLISRLDVELGLLRALPLTHAINAEAKRSALADVPTP